MNCEKELENHKQRILNLDGYVGFCAVLCIICFIFSGTTCQDSRSQYKDYTKKTEYKYKELKESHELLRDDFKQHPHPETNRDFTGIPILLEYVPAPNSDRMGKHFVDYGVNHD